MKNKLMALLLVAGMMFLAASCGGGGENGDAGDVQGDPDGTDGADAVDVPADRDAADIPADGDAADGETPEIVSDTSDAADTQEEDAASQYEGIQCGDSLVCLSPQVCCWHFAAPPTGTCTTETECMMCSSCFASQKCDGPEDCGAGQECCNANDDHPRSIECGSGDSCQRVCHTRDDCNAGELCCGTLTEDELLLFRCYGGTICPP
jgi:hypothetical protein